MSDESEESIVEDVPTGGFGEGQGLSESDTERINGISDAEGDDIREPVAPTEPVGVDFRARPPVRAFASLDSVNLVEVFSRSARDAYSPDGVPWCVPFSTEICHARDGRWSQIKGSREVHPGVEVVLLAAQDALVSTREERFGPGPSWRRGSDNSSLAIGLHC